MLDRPRPRQQETSPAVWTEEMVDQLKKLWIAVPQLSAREIGGIMNMTRNSIIGKVTRLGLEKRRRTPKRIPIRKTRGPFPVEPAPVAIVSPEIVPVGVPLMGLEAHHCRAIIGDGPDGQALYCGANKRLHCHPAGDDIYHGSFCPGHAALYYRDWSR